MELKKKLCKQLLYALTLNMITSTMQTQCLYAYERVRMRAFAEAEAKCSASVRMCVVMNPVHDVD